MKIILGILVWTFMSFAAAIVTGAFIHAGMGNENTQEGELTENDRSNSPSEGR